MLSGNTIKPRSDISNTDKLSIASSLEYLERMGFADKVACIPEDFEIYRDFEPIFGFDMENAMTMKNVNVFLKENAVDTAIWYVRISPQKKQKEAKARSRNTRLQI